jgi:serine/threonine-protein kinase
MGSPLYMSPEQIRSSRDVDVRGDVWALGVILYELLTGVAPFSANTMGATLAKIFSETPAPVGRLRPEVPEELAAVIAQCLEKELARRVQNIGELASRLAPFANREDAVSVERILRVSGIPAAPAPPPAASPVASTVGAAEAPQRATPAPRAASASASGSASQPSRDPRGETEPPWHRSASERYRLPRTGRATVIAGAIALCVAGAAVAAFVMRAPRGPGGTPAPAAAGASSAALSALQAAQATVPTATAPAQPTPEPPASVAAATASGVAAASAATSLPLHGGAAPAAHPSPARVAPAPRAASGGRPTAGSGGPPGVSPAKGNADPLGIQPE